MAQLWRHNMNTKKIASDFQLIGTAVRHIDFKNDFVSIDERSADFEKTFDLDYKVINISKSADENQWIGLSLLTIDVNLENGMSSMSMHIVIEGAFSCSSTVDKEPFKNMIEINGGASIYSIARGFITSITSQAMCGGEVILPMINVYDYFKRKNTEEM